MVLWIYLCNADAQKILDGINKKFNILNGISINRMSAEGQVFLLLTDLHKKFSASSEKE